MNALFAGIDVGTGSARAGLFTAEGRLVAAARRPIALWREAGDIVEQSSNDIWQASAAALREAVASAGTDPAAVKGIGFDATCSLVVLDPSGRPLSVSPSGERERNIVVWMDHRAVAEAASINATGHAVLRHVGGAVSPEMEMPKLLWLKRHLPATFAAAGHFLDLADFLTWRATGAPDRSLCTVGCKWNYLAHEGRWDDGFLAEIGLAELAANGHRRIGDRMRLPGEAVGGGLTEAAAADFGLAPGTPVGTGLIDAHAGGVGTLGGLAGDGTRADPAQRIAYVMGTSACIMASTPEARFVPGVWGPYLNAMLPGAWLLEGGQSTAGAAVDHILRSHAAWPKAAAEAGAAGIGVHALLERRIASPVASFSDAVRLASSRHVLPDLIGNRSPFADPEVRGILAGLSFDDSIEDLERTWVAALSGIACGLAEVMAALREQGVGCETIVISGGAGASPLVRQILADATGVPVVLPETAEPVLLGAAMLGAVAAGQFAGIEAAMAAMARDAETTPPSGGAIARIHAARRDVHAMLRRLDRDARARMAEAGAETGLGLP